VGGLEVSCEATAIGVRIQAHRAAGTVLMERNQEMGEIIDPVGIKSDP
jgi:hypothetical protein